MGVYQSVKDMPNCLVWVMFCLIIVAFFVGYVLGGLVTYEYTNDLIDCINNDCSGIVGGIQCPKLCGFSGVRLYD